MSEEKKIITTQCEKCVFAEWVNEQQCGCELGRLDIFKEQDKVEFEDGCYVIQTVCQGFRPQEWMETFEGDKLEKIDKELNIKYHAIIYYLGGDIDEIEAIKEKISKLLDADVPPQRITVVTQELRVNYRELMKNLHKEFTIPMGLSRIIDRNLSIGQKLDMPGKKSDSTFLFFVDATKQLNLDVVNEVNDRVKNQLRTTVLAYDKANPYHNCMILTLANKAWGGSRERSRR